ncbi:GIY-YIG nuclease family protein [bacterium]|nr:GIY-YIG nuclease family protein [bacterium]MBU1984044.1 GIY-YIG nuclease family protein [bacterium]
MAKKTVPFNKTGIANLPNDKPVVYTIETKDGKTNYVGSAKRGRVQERLQEHLAEGKDHVAGVKVQVRQFDSIEAAKRHESLVIKEQEPKYNEKGK